MPVVVVESPAKAKTIENFLGKDYTVLASFGHVRDLAEKEGSVNPDHNFAMKWEVPARARRHIKAIADALQKDKALILATDPDREGEAISWHLEEALRARKAIREDTTVDRIAFNSVTRRSLTEAMENPRKVDRDLVEAYLARRALDYLVGYTLSPVLWRKLPGARSAGRVQSVCLRLIVEREMEVEAFRIQEYWTVKAVLATPRGEEFEARLTVLDGNKLDRLGIPDEDRANEAVQAILSSDLSVKSVEAKPVMRSPPAPFITSTLQQEASRKLGFGAKATMQAAQKLYEAGHITYMRTDGVDMAPEAIMAVRDAIKERYGAKYLPKGPRRHKSKAKNAQEAHECIRPTRMSAHPTSLPIQDTGQLDLYDLVWMRALASQ
ncbi:MAG: DNA topoisomerase, partial [Boseongicola sp.]|nr:DNA topoisomerase [Boseongicola sp.]